MKYWFDTEFHDDGRHIELISIGIVAEDGREYHAVSSEYDWSRANPFLRDHVLPHITAARRKSRAEIRGELEAFLGVGGPPTEIWADHGEYDWIVLRQLFGDLMAWPPGWPIHAMDVEQLRVFICAGPFTDASMRPHDALEDARSVRRRWQQLQDLRVDRTK